jgi:hypothetical protein
MLIVYIFMILQWLDYFDERNLFNMPLGVLQFTSTHNAHVLHLRILNVKDSTDYWFKVTFTFKILRCSTCALCVEVNCRTPSGMLKRFLSSK